MSIILWLAKSSKYPKNVKSSRRAILDMLVFKGDRLGVHETIKTKYPRPPPKNDMSPKKGTIFHGKYIIQPLILKKTFGRFPGRKKNIIESTWKTETLHTYTTKTMGETHLWSTYQTYQTCQPYWVQTCTLRKEQLRGQSSLGSLPGISSGFSDESNPSSRYGCFPRNKETVPPQWMVKIMKIMEHVPYEKMDEFGSSPKFWKYPYLFCFLLFNAMMTDSE